MSEKKTKAELLAAAAARSAKAKEEADAREMLALELDEKYSAEGKRGVDYEVVSSDVGIFVVTKPDFTVAKVFNAVPLEKKSEEDVIKFVTPSVKYPSQDEYRATIMAHGGIAWRLARALLAMYEGNGAARTGEF